MAYGLYIYPVYGKYPRVEPLDERFDKHFSLKPKYRSPPPMKDGKVDFAAIERQLPNAVKWKDKAGRPCPDFDATPHHNVSARAKAIIEEMEPGVHGFEPVDYLYSKGATEVRYWLKVGKRVDGVDGPRSNMALKRGAWWPARDFARADAELPAGLNPKADSRLVFRQEAVASHHMWTDRYLGSSSTFISDALAERFRDAGMIGLRLDDLSSNASRSSGNDGQTLTNRSI